MAIITTGKTFGTTDAVTSVDLNNVANAATFNDPVDETSLELITSGTNIGKLQIKDAGVTKAKIENVANLRVLGNTSGSAVAPQEVEILDDDTMAAADATTLATSESIKAYVDSNGITQTTGTAPYYGVRAWASYNGNSNTLHASGNIASVTKHGTGDYEFFFDESMPVASPAISLSYSAEVSGIINPTLGQQHTVCFIASRNANSFRINTYAVSSSGHPSDKGYIGISVVC